MAIGQDHLYKLLFPVAVDFSNAVVCCDFLLPVLGSVSVTFHRMIIHIMLSAFRLLSGHLLGKSYLQG